jgi:hypothetical protein
MTNMSAFAEIPSNEAPLSRPSTDPLKIVLNEHDNRSPTGYAWSTKRKWILLTIIAFCQISMNFNATVYSNAVKGNNSWFGTVLGQKSVSLSLTRGATSIVLPTSTHHNYVKSTPNLTRGGPKCSQKAQYDIARKK